MWLPVCSISWGTGKRTRELSWKQSQSLIMWKRSPRNFQHLTHTWLKVRWAMDYMNIPYEEEENSGILGIMALGRSVPQLKVNNMSDYFRATFQIPQADLTITNSADILRYLYGCHAGRSSTKEHPQWSTPFQRSLISATNHVSWGKDSGNPAREEFLRRTDEAAAWEQKFDLLGEHYRRWLPHCSLQEVVTILLTTIMVMRNF